MLVRTPRLLGRTGCARYLAGVFCLPSLYPWVGQYLPDPAVAIAHLGLIEVVQIQALAQREQMLGLVVTDQGGFDHLAKVSLGCGA